MNRCATSPIPELPLPDRNKYSVYSITGTTNTVVVQIVDGDAIPHWGSTGAKKHLSALSDESQQRAASISAPTDLAEYNGLVSRQSRRLVEQIECKLTNDREECRQDNEIGPTSRAFQVCVRIAQRLAPHVALAPQLKFGAFTEDDGGVSLVLQSLITDRRLNCRIPPEGAPLTAIRIDEHMGAESLEFSLTDRNAPRELAEWVTKRA